MKYFGTWFRALITFVLLIGVALWLFDMASTLGIPVKSSDGTTYDEFQRSRDILAVIMPPLTTALGYWFGSAGRQDVQSTADAARAEADLAHRRLAGVLDSSSESGLLAKARKADPEAFGTAAEGTESSGEPDTGNEPEPEGRRGLFRRWRL